MARFFLALGILLLGFQSSAATNELVTQLQRPKLYSITAVAQTESNVYDSEPNGRESISRFTLAGSYRFTPAYRASLSMGVVQELENGQRGNATNAKLTGTHSPIAVTQDTNIVPIAGFRLPTNVEDRKDNSFNGAIISETSVITNWTFLDVPFSTVYTLYLTKNFHSYTRGRTGRANLDYSVINYFGVERYLTRKLSILFDGDYTYARTYQNSLRTQFSLGQSISYEFSRDLSITFGHSNGGDALRASGRDYDISVFDENTSLIYANIRAIY